jgi:hypothetical protein
MTAQGGISAHCAAISVQPACQGRAGAAGRLGTGLAVESSRFGALGLDYLLRERWLPYSA